MEKIGIFGGTFNPVHNGHVRLAKHYMEQLGLSRMLVIPTKTPPHKAAPDLADSADRLAMCRIAFEGIEGVTVSDMEIRREGKSFTVDTVHELKKEFLNAQLFLLVGSDMFLTFRKWKDWQEILKNAILCTAARTDGELQALYACGKELSEFGKTMVFDFPVFRVSSTQIREKVKKGESCRGFIDPKVEEYILHHGLYKGQDKMEKNEKDYVEIIRPLLKPKRFEHSLNVAEQAVFLAKRYGEDEHKAYVAAILHDICKNMPQNEQLQWMEKSAIILDDNLLTQPPVWHGFAGAEYIRQVLEIEDEEIINAVRYHTIGRAGMSKLEQIVYLADLTSKERDYPDAERMRQVVLHSLHEGMREALIFAVRNQAEKRLPLCIDTCQAYNEYLREETDRRA